MSDTKPVETGSEVKMTDPNEGKVDLEGGGGEGAASVIAVDETRAAIYAKHAAKQRSRVPHALSTAAAPVGDEPPANPAPDPGPGDDPAREEQVEVTINGKKRMVPASRVEEAGGIDAYQKKVAGSELLQEAAAERARLREEQEALERTRQAVIFERNQLEVERKAAPAPAAKPAIDDEALKAMAREYHEAMIDGDMDKADDLLIRMQGARPATPIDPDAIAEKAVLRAREELTAEERAKKLARWKTERLEAVGEFETNDADIAGDAELRRLVDVKTVEIYQKDPEKGPKAIISEAVQEVRDLVKRLKGPDNPASNPRLDAKRSHTVVRGGSVRAAAKPAPKPQSKSQYVQDLRARRGLS